MDDTEDTTGDTSPDREEDLERLPDRSPLATTLEQLYAAADREAFAKRHVALEYDHGRVRVSVRLEPGGKPPEEYLSEDRSEYDDMIVAFIEIDDLVNLALDDNVRSVRIPPQQEPHGGK